MHVCQTETLLATHCFDSTLNKRHTGRDVLLSTDRSHIPAKVNTKKRVKPLPFQLAASLDYC